jgi:hypothetical protein
MELVLPQKPGRTPEGVGSNLNVGQVTRDEFASSDVLWDVSGRLVKASIQLAMRVNY